MPSAKPVRVPLSSPLLVAVLAAACTPTEPAKPTPPVDAFDIVADAAQVRALVPLALEAMMTEHEANRATSAMMRSAIGPACTLTGDILGRLIAISAALELDAERMRRNLDLTDGMILSEAIMMDLGRQLGRQVAHDLVYDAVDKVLAGEAAFVDALSGDPQIRDRLGEDGLQRLGDPAAYTGLCADMARQQAAAARATADAITQEAADWE